MYGGTYSEIFTSTRPPVAHPTSSLAPKADLLLHVLLVPDGLHHPARLAPDAGGPGVWAECDQAPQALLGPATLAGLCSCQRLGNVHHNSQNPRVH